MMTGATVALPVLSCRVNAKCRCGSLEPPALPISPRYSGPGISSRSRLLLSKTCLTGEAAGSATGDGGGCGRDGSGATGASTEGAGGGVDVPTSSTWELNKGDAEPPGGR